MKRHAMPAAAALLLAAGLASAQPGVNRSACIGDVQSFCSGAGTGSAVKECLLDHQQQISDGCYDFLKSVVQRAKTSEACAGDVPRYCKGIAPGEGRMVDCLIDHQQQISDGCYAALKRQLNAGNAADGGGARLASPSGPVYRARQADGSVIYSDTHQANTSGERQLRPSGAAADDSR